jgi:outer membrane protein assembly factor BamE
MPAPTFRPLRPSMQLLAAIALCALASGCSSLDSASNRVVGLVTPYKVEVIQGNFVSSEQAALLKPGMERAQVRDILGTPLMASVFHENRWDYVFTIKRSGTEPQIRKFTVFFRGNELERFEGGDLPSEAEFVSTLDSKRKLGKVPELEASEESLKNFKSGKPAAATAAAPAASPAPSAASYPPLEGSAQ